MPFCIHCGAEVNLSDNKCPKCYQELPNLELKEDIFESKNKEVLIPPASPSKRIFSGLIDLLIGFVLPLLLMAFAYKKMALTGMKLKWLIAGRYIFPFLPGVYLILKDSFGGKSFGKMIIGLTTINIDKRLPANLADSLLRNSIFIIGIIPFLGWLAIVILAALIGIQVIMGSPRRFGDNFAHTMVIEDKNIILLEDLSQNIEK